MSSVGLNGFVGKIGNATSYSKVYTTSTNENLAYLKYLNNKPIYSNSNTVTLINPAKNLVIPGDLTVYGTIINPSDAKLKDNLSSIFLENDIKIETNNIMHLKPITYNLKLDKEPKTHYGFIAQELENVFPSLVVEKEMIVEDEVNNTIKYKAVNYIELIPILVQKIQEMQEEINELKRDLAKK
jgi:hypothetical protein